MSATRHQAHAPWPVTKLGDVCDIIIGRTPARNRGEYWGPGAPWLSIADMNQGRDIETTSETITEVAIRECNCRPISADTVLLSFKLSIGKVGIARRTLYTNEAIAALPIKDSTKLFRDFLYWALRSIDLRLGLDRAAKGLTLNSDKLQRILVPLPPLTEQRRIANFLDKADVLLAKHRAALALLDSLEESVFVRLFGNPILNERRWPLAKLADVASIERGKFTPRPRNDPNFYGGSFPFIQTGDIARSGGRVQFWSQTLNSKGIGVSRSFPPGTVVIAIVGATLGITAILDIEVYCPDSVIGIQPRKDRVLAEYIERVLRFWRPIFVAQAPETARANINLETLRPIRIPLPPISLQKEFRHQIARVKELRSVHEASLKKTDNLISALGHRAFKGEL